MNLMKLLKLSAVFMVVHAIVLGFVFSLHPPVVSKLQFVTPPNFPEILQISRWWDVLVWPVALVIASLLSKKSNWRFKLPLNRSLGLIVDFYFIIAVCFVGLVNAVVLVCALWILIVFGWFSVLIALYFLFDISNRWFWKERDEIIPEDPVPEATPDETQPNLE